MNNFLAIMLITIVMELGNNFSFINHYNSYEL